MERYVEGVKSGWRKSERASGFAKGNPSRSSSSEELREELVRVSEIWTECQPPTSFFIKRKMRILYVELAHGVALESNCAEV